MMRKTAKIGIVTLGLTLGLDGVVLGNHVDTEIVPEDKRTAQESYLTAREAYALKSNQSEVIFIDVRSFEEISKSGTPALKDASIPYLVVDRKTGQKDGRYLSDRYLNPDFLRTVHALRESRGATTDTPIIVICQAGRVSARAADLLALAGFKHVYVVLNGFEGDMAPGTKSQASKDELGWKPSGLPWAYLTEQVNKDRKKG